MKRELNSESKHVNPADHLANERTFLAWIRTSIALMGFGFVVVKFSLFIRQLSFILSAKPFLPKGSYSSEIGILLVGMGAIIALLAFFRYYVTEKRLISGTYEPSLLLSMFLTIIILVICIFLTFYLLPSL